MRPSLMPGKVSGGFGDAQLPVNHLPAASDHFPDNRDFPYFFQVFAVTPLQHVFSAQIKHKTGVYIL